MKNNTSENDQKTNHRINKYFVRHILSVTLNPVITVSTLIAFGVVLIYYNIMDYQIKDFVDNINKKGLSFIGFFFFFIAYIIIMVNLNNKAVREKSFTDIDKENKEKKEKKSAFEFLHDIQLANNISVLDNNTLSRLESANEEITFVKYFDGIKRVLESQIDLADVKASKLLDQGTKYAKYGVFFYIGSIVAWQIYAWFLGEMKPQIIYGIASTSFIFIFIEFLSAWFLKQYRNFVDTSTYLIKIKSIFDRYLLIVLYVQENRDKEIREDVIKNLSDEIKWPDISKFSRQEVSFAKEALDTATEMMKTLKINFNSSKEEKNKESKEEKASSKSA